VARIVSYDQHIRRIIILSAVLSVILLITHAVYLQYNIIDDSIKQEARKTSALSFEALYAAMARGWNQEDIDAITTRLNRVDSNMHIEVFRSPSVEAIFGKRTQEHPDALVQQAITEKTDQAQITQPGQMRYIYPISFESACLRCHSNAQVGESAGAISVTFPVSAIRFSGGMIFNMFILVSIAMLGTVFLLLYFYLRRHLVNPLKRFAFRIRTIMGQGDLTQRIVLNSNVKEIKDLEQSFNELTTSLHITQEQLTSLSITDDLTGLYNRRHFETSLRREIERAGRYETAFSLIMIDLDNFKPINDDYGHIAGDKMLIAVAGFLADNVRKTDMVARLGGDEYVILLPEAGKEQAQAAAQKLRLLLSGATFDIEGHQLGINASFGVASFPIDGATPNELLESADQQMYRVKR